MALTPCATLTAGLLLRNNPRNLKLGHFNKSRTRVTYIKKHLKFAFNQQFPLFWMIMFKQNQGKLWKQHILKYTLSMTKSLGTKETTAQNSHLI